MRDPRTDPRPGDRLRVRLVRVEVLDTFGAGPFGLVSCELNGNRSSMTLRDWQRDMELATVEYAGGSDG